MKKLFLLVNLTRAPIMFEIVAACATYPSTFSWQRKLYCHRNYRTVDQMQQQHNNKTDTFRILSVCLALVKTEVIQFSRLGGRSLGTSKFPGGNKIREVGTPKADSSNIVKLVLLSEFWQLDDQNWARARARARTRGSRTLYFSKASVFASYGAMALPVQYNSGF